MDNKPTVFIVAAEVSGDQHAANLVIELRALNNNIHFEAVGGKSLLDANVSLYMSFDKLAVMGFWEVLKKAFVLQKLINRISTHIILLNPNAIILVDASGLNMRLAKKIKNKTSIPIHYYIAPKVWAWGEWRVKKMAKLIDYLYCILPFEEAYFRNKNISSVFYVGNPTFAAINKYQFKAITDLDNNNQGILALLPGSRKQEIAALLPMMLKVAKSFTQYRIVLACTESISPQFYDYFIGKMNITKVYNQTWDLLKIAEKAIVTSGTATLECALIGCPQIVCYSTSKISYFLGRRLIKVKYISLPNLILDKPVLTELIQDDVSPNRIKKALKECTKIEAIKIQTDLIKVLSNHQKGIGESIYINLQANI